MASYVPEDVGLEEGVHTDSELLTSSSSTRLRRNLPKFKRAVDEGDINAIHSILEGMDLNKFAIEWQGRTLLHIACRRTEPRHIDKIIDTLIERGVNVDAQDGSGKTALIYAAQRGLTEAAKHLISCDADPSIADNKDRTASMWAERAGYSDLAETLSTSTTAPGPSS